MPIHNNSTLSNKFLTIKNDYDQQEYKVGKESFLLQNISRKFNNALKETKASYTTYKADLAEWQFVDVTQEVEQEVEMSPRDELLTSMPESYDINSQNMEIKLEELKKYVHRLLSHYKVVDERLVPMITEIDAEVSKYKKTLDLKDQINKDFSRGMIIKLIKDEDETIFDIVQKTIQINGDTPRKIGIQDMQSEFYTSLLTLVDDDRSKRDYIYHNATQGGFLNMGKSHIGMREQYDGSMNAISTASEKRSFVYKKSDAGIIGTEENEVYGIQVSHNGIPCNVYVTKDGVISMSQAIFESESCEPLCNFSLLSTFQDIEGTFSWQGMQSLKYEVYQPFAKVLFPDSPHAINLTREELVAKYAQEQSTSTNQDVIKMFNIAKDVKIQEVWEPLYRLQRYVPNALEHFARATGCTMNELEDIKQNCKYNELSKELNQYIERTIKKLNDTPDEIPNTLSIIKELQESIEDVLQSKDKQSLNELCNKFEHKNAAAQVSSSSEIKNK